MLNKTSPDFFPLLNLYIIIEFYKMPLYDIVSQACDFPVEIAFIKEQVPFPTKSSLVKVSLSFKLL